MLASLFLLAQVAIPAPKGFVNDFAGVLDAASVTHLDAVVEEVRNKTKGEIAVVTLTSIGDREASDVALQIGRDWGVGAQGAAGDRARNLGVVVLLVPLQDGRPGTGRFFIATGRGAEGFLPDGRVGRIADEAVPYLAREQYGPGLVVAVDLLAQAFAAEFGVTLQPQPGGPALRPQPVQPQIPRLWIVLFVIFLLIVTRGRIFLLPMLLGGRYGRSGRFGGFGRSGGFGGFGGGGGFSGGGAGRSF